MCLGKQFIGLIERGTGLCQGLLQRAQIHFCQSQITFQRFVTVLIHQVFREHGFLAFKAIGKRSDQQTLPFNGDLLNTDPCLGLLHLGLVGLGIQCDDGIALGY